MTEPREEGGKDFWAKFDLKKWLEDANEVGEILRKSMEREEMVPCSADVYEERLKKMNLALPKKEGEGCICGHFRWASCPVHGVKQIDPRDSLVDWESRFDYLYANEWKPGHKHNERCEFTCCLRGDIKNFIRQHFISRTAVEKMIEGVANPYKARQIRAGFARARKEFLELLEKINKE